jgi:hypothetical protein
VIDALSKTRESTKGSFILYIMGTTILIMILIIGTIELSQRVDDPRFVAPSGATVISINSNTSSPVTFYLQNHANSGNQGRIQGTYQIKDGILTGEVANSELEPDPRGVLPSAPLTSISVHVCYFGVQNHLPIFGQVPQFPVPSNFKAITAMENMQQPFSIPAFTFAIDIKHADISYVAPPYLCAFVDGPNAFPHMVYY